MTEGVEALVLHPESRTIPCSRCSCSIHFPPSAPSNSQAWLNVLIQNLYGLQKNDLPTFCLLSEAPSLSPSAAFGYQSLEVGIHA